MGLILKNQNGDMTQKEFYHVFLLTAQRSGILERELKIMGDRLATTERRISQLTAEPAVEVAIEATEEGIEATEERIEAIEDALEQLEEKSLLRVSSSPSRKRLRVSNSSAVPRSSRVTKSRKIK